MGKNYKIAAVVLAAALFLSPKQEPSNTMSFPLVPEKNLSNAKIYTLENGKSAYRIADLSYQNESVPLFTDMVLSLNYPSENLQRDDTKKYRIRRSEYEFVNAPGSLGGCAKFFKKEHCVEIETPADLWLGRCGDLGSFTIEFRFMPQRLLDGSVIFSRTGFLTGKKRGLEIAVSRSRIVARLYDMFEYYNGAKYERVDVFLNKGTALREGVWYHFSLSFDRESGRLAKYLNGGEEDAMYLTDGGEPFGTAYLPSFGHRKDNTDRDGKLRCIEGSDAVLGRGFNGCIDEFRIFRADFGEMKEKTHVAIRNYSGRETVGRIPFNVEGVVTSPVYSFTGTGTQVTLFRWDEIIKKNTFIWMEFRTQDRLFEENDTSLKWYRVNNNQRGIYLQKTAAGEFLRGRYCQWRAHLVASPGGKESPSLHGICLEFLKDEAPNPPLFPEVVQAGDEQVILKWKKNVDPDIHGYRVYYGTVRDKTEGILSWYGGKRIDNQMASGEFITLKITNEIIEENRQKDKKRLLEYPFLKNTVLYFFAVSAYDSYKPDTEYNHESLLSGKVSARPFAGNEIEQDAH